MNVQDSINATMDVSSMVLNSYISDLSDSELMKRPGKGCNHVAWQLGHLIQSEVSLLNMVCPGKGPELPAGFAEKHSKESVGSDDPAQFCTKQEYLELFDKVHAATKSALAELTEADLDQPGPEGFRSMFPTVGHLFVLIATHAMMHAGQLVPLRRELGKPVVI